ncbi:hypothetical protein [Heyndrickxia oleronia]|jgi:hypothetical protein|uniref:hypothetical protein n=1 Tax=Heyndrickxia oleronia TaxID=38875 RepID=UPI00242DD973|nr:hypothetical protein [Heyndrickxia oleronia]MCI1763644.1 hypothetical protein [Heyndrickxia oleronia]
MAVLVNKQSDFVVEGGYRASADTVPGTFVTVNYADKTASGASSGEGAKLVLQRNNTIDQQAVADSDVVYKKNEFLPLRTLQLGDVITTDQFVGTYASINEGDKFVVGADGKAEAGTPEVGSVGLAVKDKTTLFGKEAIKFEVVTV